MNTPEINHVTTRIKSFKDNSRTVIFDYDRFAALNASFIRFEGVSMLDAAESNPADVYNFIRAAIGASAASSAVEISKDGLTLADSHHNEESAVHDIAEEVVRDILPADYEGARIVRIAIESSVADLEYDVAGFIEIMELHVAPPNLAA